MTRLFVDSANVARIAEYTSYGIVSGVTTNPVLLRKECTLTNQDPLEIVREICSIVPRKTPVSMQIVSDDYDSRMREIATIRELHENCVVKLPPDKLTLKILSENSDLRNRVNVTGVFTPALLYLFSLSSPAYISCILDKNEDWGQGNSFNLGGSLATSKSGSTKTIGASIRSPLSMTNALCMGFDILTIPISTLDCLFTDVRSTSVIQEMVRGWSTIMNKPVAI